MYRIAYFYLFVNVSYEVFAIFPQLIKENTINKEKVKQPAKFEET